MTDYSKQIRIRIGGEREVVSGFGSIGRAIGGTAGQVLQLSSRLAKLGASIGPLGVAIGGLGAALVLLGKKISDLADRDMQRAISQAEAAKNTFSALRAEIDQVLQRRAMEAAGMGELGEQFLRAREAYNKLDMARADLETQIKKMREDASYAGVAGEIARERAISDLETRLASVRLDMEIARAELTKLGPLASAERAENLSKRAAGSAPRGRAAGVGRGEVDLESAIAAARAEEDARRREAEQAAYWGRVELDLRRELGEQQLAWQDELEERRYRAAEDAARKRIELEAESQRQHADTVRMGAEMLVAAIDIGIGKGAAAMAAYISRELRALGMSESVKALVSLATGDMVGAGRHAAAAAAAFAGSAAVSALFPGGGGGGGGAAASPAARAAAQGGGVAETTPTGGSVTIIINGDLLGDEGSGRRISEYIDAYNNRRNPGRQQSSVRV